MAETGSPSSSRRPGETELPRKGEEPPAVAGSPSVMQARLTLRPASTDRAPFHNRAASVR